jgi:hypothetical protein
MISELLMTGAESTIDPLVGTISLLVSLLFSLVITWVYKTTHRGLTYSQSFQFSLVLLGVLGTAIMVVASGSLLRAIGILGAFSIIRFRTAIKDPKDMAFIMFVLTVGLATGAQMYAFAAVETVLLSIVILVLTKLNFGSTSRHESIIRLLCEAGTKNTINTVSYEAIISKLTESFHLLSAHTRGNRIELTYGIHPKRNSSTLSVLEALRKETGIEDVELFDAKHQVEF